MRNEYMACQRCCHAMSAIRRGKPFAVPSAGHESVGTGLTSIFLVEEDW